MTGIGSVGRNERERKRETGKRAIRRVGAATRGGVSSGSVAT